MQTPDGIYLEQALEQSAAALKEAVSSLSEVSARRKPGPGGWSAVECIEHIAMVDDGFSARIVKSQAGTEPVSDPAREATLVSMVVSRETPISAPAVVQPQGKFQTLPDALAHFDDTRKIVRERIADVEPRLRFLQVEHPVLGVITGYEAFLILPAHTHRHIKQIQESATWESAQ